MFADGRAGEPRLGWPAYFIAAILAVSILFGGGGAEGAFNNGVILAVSAFLLCGLVAAHAIGVRPLSGSAVVPVFLILAFLLIGAFQLVPLQPEMWRTQPGRELAAPILQLVHAGNGSRPLSLDPEATRRALAAMLLPAAMMIGVAGSTRREISLLLHVIIGCAVVSSAMGALQLALGY